MKKLSQYAKEQNRDYKEVWGEYKSGVLPVKTKVSKTGRIYVMEETKASTPLDIKFGIPAFADMNEIKASAVRRNKASTSERTDEYYWIENGVDPVNSSGRGKNGNDNADATAAIRLVRLAYTNFSDLRNIINAMVEFSSSPIYWSGGNAKSRKFFESLFNKLGINNLQDKFFLEFFRSCNVIPYRLEAVIKDEDLNTLNKTYGAKAKKNVKLPVKYIILNPESLVVGGNISFSEATFYQRLNTYEVQRLMKPITEEDKNFFNSLPDDLKEDIKKARGKISNITLDIPLDQKYCHFIFYKKADYEPLATPFAWPVLRDLNWKAELKAIDMAVARTTQRAILLITMGFENKNGEYMFDAKAAEAMRQLFESESVGKVLVGDFTTKGQWLIPEVDKILGQEKYKQVNEDIKNGLNNILSGGGEEKFANQSIKVKLFVQRLKQSRETFLNEFLIPEVKRISKEMGFKSYPLPIFADIDLRDEDTYARILAQLAGIGYLTPEEVFNGMEFGRLPTAEESLESQQNFKDAKDKGLYLPVQANPQGQLQVLKEQGKQQVKMAEINNERFDKQKNKDRELKQSNPEPAPINVNMGPQKQTNPSGRPPGSKSPQTVQKKVKPISAELVKANLILATNLNKELEKSLCKKFNIKKLNEEQESVKNLLLENIMMNEVSASWDNKDVINKYLENPDYKNEDRFNHSLAVGAKYSVPDYLAGILANSEGPEVEVKENIE